MAKLKKCTYCDDWEPQGFNFEGDFYCSYCEDALLDRLVEEKVIVAQAGSINYFHDTEANCSFISDDDNGAGDVLREFASMAKDIEVVL